MKCGVVRELSSYLNTFQNIRSSLLHHPSCRSAHSCPGLSTGKWQKLSCQSGPSCCSVNEHSLWQFYSYFINLILRDFSLFLTFLCFFSSHTLELSPFEDLRMSTLGCNSTEIVTITFQFNHNVKNLKESTIFLHFRHFNFVYDVVFPYFSYL